MKKICLLRHCIVWILLSMLVDRCCIVSFLDIVVHFSWLRKYIVYLWICFVHFSCLKSDGFCCLFQLTGKLYSLSLDFVVCFSWQKLYSLSLDVVVHLSLAEKLHRLSLGFVVLFSWLSVTSWTVWTGRHQVTSRLVSEPLVSPIFTVTCLLHSQGVCVCVHACLCVCAWVFVYVCACMCVGVHAWICVFESLCVCVHTPACACACVCACVCVHVCGGVGVVCVFVLGGGCSCTCVCTCVWVAALEFGSG